MYFIEVINCPKELSAVWRTKIDDSPHRSYYLIVEASSKNGEKRHVLIRNYETDRNETVTKWAVEVSSEIDKNLRWISKMMAKFKVAKSEAFNRTLFNPFMIHELPVQQLPLGSVITIKNTRSELIINCQISLCT